MDELIRRVRALEHAVERQSAAEVPLVADGKSLTVTNTLTLSGTDGVTVTFPQTGTVAYRDLANTFTAAQTIDDTLAVGTADAGDAQVHVEKAVTVAGGVGVVFQGVLAVANVQVADAADGVAIGVEAKAWGSVPAGQTYRELVALHGVVESFTGTVAIADSVRASLTVEGTVTTGAGLRVEAPVVTGTVATFYGVRVEDLGAGAGTAWAVYVVGDDPSRFGGTVYVGDDANTMMTQGMTINQGAADNEILAFKSSDIAHGMTDIAERDTYGHFRKVSATDGGIAIFGFNENTSGVYIVGCAPTASTTKSAAARAAVHVSARQQSGTSVGSFSADANLFVVQNHMNTRFIFDAEGDLHADAAVNANAFDEWDDLQLVRALELERNPAGLIRSQFDEWVTYNREDLEAAGIATFNDGPGGDGSVFVNYTALVRLLSGATWQLHTRLARLEAAQLREG